MKNLILVLRRTTAILLWILASLGSFQVLGELMHGGSGLTLAFFGGLEVWLFAWLAACAWRGYFRKSNARTVLPPASVDESLGCVPPPIPQVREAHEGL